MRNGWKALWNPDKLVQAHNFDSVFFYDKYDIIWIQQNRVECEVWKRSKFKLNFILKNDVKILMQTVNYNNLNTIRIDILSDKNKYDRKFGKLGARLEN